MFTRGFLIFVLCLLVIGAILTIQRWDLFIHTFTSFLSLEGVALLILTTVFVKIFHELGHAYMAHKYNVPVSVMGIALIIFYPILYTETTNAWRLRTRRERIHIACAGLLAELSLAAIALMFWHILSSGFWQNIMYFIAFASFGLSVFVNMNPLMKFDGYYLLCDLTSIDNLQSRAVNFFKWRYRKTLLGINPEKPESVRPSTERFLTGFGLALIIYRFFLYLGISLAVYYFFFKPLGLIIMVMTLGLFIGLPILKELHFYYMERKGIFTNMKSKIVLGSVILALILSFLPLDRHIHVPAVLHAQNYTLLYTPLSAHIEDIRVKNGDVVEKGDVLLLSLIHI